MFNASLSMPHDCSRLVSHVINRFCCFLFRFRNYAKYIHTYIYRRGYIIAKFSAKQFRAKTRRSGNACSIISTHVIKKLTIVEKLFSLILYKSSFLVNDKDIRLIHLFMSVYQYRNRNFASKNK